MVTTIHQIQPCSCIVHWGNIQQESLQHSAAISRSDRSRGAPVFPSSFCDRAPRAVSGILGHSYRKACVGTIEFESKSLNVQSQWLFWRRILLTMVQNKWLHDWRVPTHGTRVRYIDSFDLNFFEEFRKRTRGSRVIGGITPNLKSEIALSNHFQMPFHFKSTTLSIYIRP